MPAHPPTPTSESPNGGILLVEEYDALGVAISSALRKFAPLHAVRVAHSFAEAEIAAAAMRPELFVLDLDPPLAGDIEFFNQLNARYPEARALVIAAGTSRELRAERGTAGAIQFIEKPFDLAEFGAAVQALLGRWALPPSTHFRGTLRDLQLVDIVQLKCLALSNAVVRLETLDGKFGDVYFQKGQICHAATGALSGLAALEEIARWPGGHLSETELPAETPGTINESWPVLLLQMVRRLAGQEGEHSLGAPPAHPAAVAKTGRKILVIDDTEMLLIFVADILATADPTFQIVTAATGAEGIRLAGAARPDLILLDYSLADMTGDTVCRALLENEVTARIPVLMMSGHLTELTRTARDYKNVVVSLPKPFLSGALINEVEKVLAAGPLSKAPPSAAIPKVASPVEDLPAPPPNEGGRGTLSPALNAPSLSPAIPAPIPAPPLPPAPQPAPQPPAAPASARTSAPAASLVRLTEVSVTLSLEVVSMRLTPSLRMEAATLQPFSPMVAVKMGDEREGQSVPLETGFRLSAIRLFDDGRLDTMRLVPTRQPPQLPAAKSSFAIGSMSVEQTGSHPNLQLTALKDDTMRVLLMAQVDLLAVELSVGFEVVAVLLKARGTTVTMRNGPGGGGAPFALERAELNPSAELRSLVVRAPVQ